MPFFDLFGQRVSVPASGGRATLHSGATVEASFPSAQGMTLIIDGPLPQGRAEAFRVALTVRHDGDEVVPIGAASAHAGGTLYVRMAQSTDMEAVPAPRIAVRRADGAGIAVAEVGSLVERMVTSADNRYGFVLPGSGANPWRDWAVTFDVARGQARYHPGGGQAPWLEIRDRVDYGRGSGAHAVSNTQRAALVRLTVAADAMILRAEPPDGVLLLHADALDKGPDGAGPTRDALVYQEALVNGVLDWIVPDAGGEQRLAWSDAGRGAPGLLAFRWRDEHGNPVVLLPGVATGFDIVRRFGRPDTPGQGEATLNRTLVAVPRGDAMAAGLAILDPAATYGRLENVDDLARPGWVVAGRTPILSEPPLELHGVADRVFLRLDGGYHRTLRARKEPFACRFAALAVSFKGYPLFHRSEIRFDQTSSLWTLVAGFVERDLAAGLSDSAAGPASARTAAGRDVAQLVLPLVDTTVALANLAGRSRSGTGVLLSAGAEWHQRCDAQFAGPAASHFERPQPPGSGGQTGQTHVKGFRALPERDQPFQEVLRPLLMAAPALDATAPPGARLMGAAPVAPVAPLAPTLMAAPTATHEFAIRYVHGGDAGDAHVQLDNRMAAARVAGDVFQRFQTAWIEPPAEAAEAVRSLKRVIGSFRLDALPDTDSDAAWTFFEDLLVRARAVAEDPAVREALSEYDFDQIVALLANMAVEELEDRWRDAADTLAPLFEWVWEAPTRTLFQRVAGLVMPELGRADEATEEVRRRLGSALPVLVQHLVPLPQVPGLPDNLKTPLEGLLTFLNVGVDAIFQRVADWWKDTREGTVAELDMLRAKYGPLLTGDVYRRLIEAVEDGSVLRDLIAAELGIDLADLADLRVEPPEYLVLSSAFIPKGQPQPDKSRRLWNHRLDLCRQGNGVPWFFFLDQSSTVVIKLAGGRDVKDILQDIHESYRTAARPDPLRLGGEGAGGNPVAAFADTLHPAIRHPEWQGALVIRPVADISSDKILRDLCGFEHIEAQYAAIGGRALADADVDVTARIVRRQDQPTEKPGGSGWSGDAGFALTKFDAVIRNTRIEQAEIEFRLDLRNMLGRDRADAAFPPVFIRGALPPADTAAGGMRSFEFGARFAEPMRFRIDVMFLKEVYFQALRVGPHNGRTALHIDGGVELRDYAGLNVGIGGEPGIALNDFRILLPELAGGTKMDFGLSRPVDFDFPSIRFALPKPKTVTMYGIDITPLGVGYVRGTGDGLAQLQARFKTLVGSIPGAPAPGRTYPYLTFRVDFGKLPVFGGGPKGLAFDMLVGAEWEREAKALFAGIGGLSARDIRIDLFRLLTLEADSLELSNDYRLGFHGDTPVDIGAVIAKKVRLSILGWSPLKEGSRLDFLMLHRDPGGSASPEKGFAFIYEGTDDEKTSQFFRLYWFLLANNLELPQGVYDHLLTHTGTDAASRSIVNLLVPEKGGNRVYARMSDGLGWLAGISFGLGDLLDRCTLVLHDQKYYGIHLSAKWVPLVFGQDTIELAYIPGASPEMDRFRTNLRLPLLDMLGTLRSGDFTLEWAVNWDFLVDVGYPWYVGNGYDWFRSFSIPVGIYEGKFGFFIEKRTQIVPEDVQGDRHITLSAGFGLYIGYFFGFGNSVAWIRAGIGVFAILQGSVTLRNTQDLRGAVVRARIIGVIGIFAYGEGGIDVWVISARFRVWAQASVTCDVLYQAGSGCVITYSAVMAQSYSASVRVGSGMFSFEFSVSGTISMPVSGQMLLS